MSRRIIVAVVAIVLAVAGGAVLHRHTAQQSAGREVNVLIWAGYDDPSLILPFEQQTGLKVRYKTFVGADAMFALLTQSKGVYDAVIVDPEYIAKLQALGRLAVLDPAEFSTADYVPSMRDFPGSKIDGKTYAIIVEFGALALVYNTNHISRTEAESYAVLYTDKLRGKVGVWDWYLPIMGVISRSMGNEQPYNLSNDQFNALRKQLTLLRPQIRAFHATIPEVIQALANEDTWAVPGGAAWAASALQQMGKPYDWIVPREGGVMWTDSVAIPADAPNPAGGKAYAKWLMSPEAQAALSQKKAYHSNVPNLKAYDLMPVEHRRRLKSMTQADIESLIGSLAIRSLPTQQTEAQWQAAWETFKNQR